MSTTDSSSTYSSSDEAYIMKRIIFQMILMKVMELMEIMRSLMTIKKDPDYEPSESE